MDYKSPCKFTTLFRIMIPNSIFLSIFTALNYCDVLLNVPSTIEGKELFFFKE